MNIIAMILSIYLFNLENTSGLSAWQQLSRRDDDVDTQHWKDSINRDTLNQESEVEVGFMERTFWLAASTTANPSQREEPLEYLLLGSSHFEQINPW